MSSSTQSSFVGSARSCITHRYLIIIMKGRVGLNAYQDGSEHLFREQLSKFKWHFLIFGEVERSKNGRHDKFWPICSLLIFIIMVNIVNVVNMVNMLCTVHYRVAGVAQAALDEKFGLGRKF